MEQHKLFITGDIHGQIDIARINKKNWPDQFNLTRQDYLLQLGDLGLLWKKDKTFNYLLDFYTSRKYTLLWIEGNHENHTWLNTFPIIQWNGGKVHKIADNIFHLMRGEIYNIYNKTFFTFGGGLSIDKNKRIIYIDWWPEEEANYQEQINAINNLEKYNYKIDYILTHSAPELIKNQVGFKNYTSNTEQFLQYINNKLIFNKWFIGHYHIDQIYQNYYFIYNKILSL